MPKTRAGRIGIDIDGTLWETWSIAHKHAENLVGKELEFPWPDYHYLRQFGDDIAERAFTLACGPEGVEDRVLFPHCHEALNEIEQFAHLHFVTHSPAGQRMRPHLEQWLDRMLKLPYDLTIVETLNKLRVAQRHNMFGIIDDRPSTIREFLDEGYFVATKYHDYLNPIIAERKDLKVFQSWEYAPIIIMEAMKQRGLLKRHSRFKHKLGSRVPYAIT